MPVLPDAVHLHRTDYVGTFPFEWEFDELERDGVAFPIMHHLTTGSSFVLGLDDAPPDGALPRYALLLIEGILDPQDRTAIVYLGRAAIWTFVQQMPEIQAILNESRDPEDAG